MNDIQEQESYLDNLLSETQVNGKYRALRLLACWLARETRPRKYCLEAIDLSEKFAKGEIGIEVLKARQSEMKGFAIATTTIGMNHNLPQAHSDMCSFQTLRESALEAAILAKSHYLGYITSKAENEGLSPERIESLKRETITRAIVKMKELLGLVEK